MRAFGGFAWRLLTAIPLLLLSLLILLFVATALGIADAIASFRRGDSLPADEMPDTQAATVVIPNWNGRELLEKYLPSVIEALRGNTANEVVVVDNGSADGSVGWLSQHFPGVKVLALETNLGFGGGSNAGFRAAANDIVVLLNSDMRVDSGFLAPLLESFSDRQVFAVSCQIFFSDPSKLREETGLTAGWWESGGLRVTHRDDPAVDRAFPCFYGGGGSCAFDRRKFLELGGFDELLAPFYLEDTDLGYMAWKRGWKVLYEPRSIVFHEHRGTIGKRFAERYIESVLKKNYLLFCWKNIHEGSKIASHLLYALAGVGLAAIWGDAPHRSNFHALWRAFRKLGPALRSRLRARSLAAVSDTEAFLRPRGGFFRDRFASLPAEPQQLGVLFISPYPICPPVHGGGVFMYQTTRELARLCRLNLIIMLDYADERDAHDEMDRIAESTDYLARTGSKPKEFGAIDPAAVREFRSDDLDWKIHRQIYLKAIDVVQLEYTAMAQYGQRFHRIACFLFEHDVFFQSIGRQWPRMRSALTKAKAGFEYLRALRYELGVLERFDRVQVCSPANKQYLSEFRPEMRGRIDDDLRAGIETGRYNFQPDDREPGTMLFLGSFRHTPNQEALRWFTTQVMPLILARRPGARLVVVGSEPPPLHSFPQLGDALEVRGFVEDVREPLSRYAVFVCPILGGSGMRVKLLEAFAAGMPVVSTRMGAEGLAETDGVLCRLADDAQAFAQAAIGLMSDRAEARALALRARDFVRTHRDMPAMTQRLVENYRATVRKKRSDARRSPG